MTTRSYEINPVEDPRWPEFLERHRSATVFHSREWLGALQQTYGYEVGALTTTPPEERLTNALVFCRVNSALTGRRVVSLPFSDHCVPLADDDDDLACLLSRLKEECNRRKDKYLEIRWPTSAPGMTDSGTFCMHRLDLRPGLGELFSALHESCIRRKIIRAQREGVVYEEGHSDELLLKFYRLMVLTRRRHRVLPQPFAWFRNIVRAKGGIAKIRLASHQGRPAACTLTIRYKNTMTYKYGCSDPRFHRLGAMQLLMWKTIEEAKSAGLTELDLGRTDWDNPGLLAYKDRWGAQRSTLSYARYSTGHSSEGISFHLPRSVFAMAPESFLSTAGRILYRHIG